MKTFLSKSCSQIAVGFLILATVCIAEEDNKMFKIEHLDSVPENYFHLYNVSSDITKVEICNSAFSTLPENVFENLTNLEMVDLGFNALSTLPEHLFKNQNKLQVLDFYENALEELPEGIFENLTNLQSLNLTDNELSELPDNVFKSQSNLKVLILSDNAFDSLSQKVLENLNDLQILDLSWNKFRNLSENMFMNLTNLETLILSKNNLRSLPENVFEHQINLKTLDLHGNVKSSLRENLFKLPENLFKSQANLLSLDISLNKFSNLSENIFDGLVNLEVLDLGQNVFTTLPENLFKNLTNLKSLDLNHNKLTSLPENVFKSLVNLRVLDLNKNKFQTLPEKLFKYQSNLLTLVLNSNKLSSLPENVFQSLVNLKSLDLNNNKLTSLPDDLFKSQTKLQSLDLDENMISTLATTTMDDIYQNENLTGFKINKYGWMCDCDFMVGIMPYVHNYPLSMSWCEFGPIFSKLQRPLLPMIENKTVYTGDYNEKYVNVTLCPVTATNKLAGTCPSGCNCLYPTDNSSVFFDCSMSMMNSVPSNLGDVLYQTPAVKKIELNISSNGMVDLPNSSLHGFELITKMTASNNSINSISVENLPENLVEMDLSDNKLVTLSVPVLQKLGNMKMLKVLILGGNLWTCDESFVNYVQSNKAIVDYEHIVCNDGESLSQKLNGLTKKL